MSHTKWDYYGGPLFLFSSRQIDKRPQSRRGKCFDQRLNLSTIGWTRSFWNSDRRRASRGWLVRDFNPDAQISARFPVCTTSPLPVKPRQGGATSLPSPTGDPPHIRRASPIHPHGNRCWIPTTWAFCSVKSASRLISAKPPSRSFWATLTYALAGRRRHATSTARVLARTAALNATTRAEVDSMTGSSPSPTWPRMRPSTSR